VEKALKKRVKRAVHIDGTYLLDSDHQYRFHTQFRPRGAID
jgi:hypothetical protein